MKAGWKTVKLEEVCAIEFGERVVRKNDAGTLYPVYGGGGATFNIDRHNRESCVVVSRFGMSERCVRFVEGKFFLNDSGLTVTSTSPEVSQGYIDLLLHAKAPEIYALGGGTAQKNLDTKSFRSLQIPLPPLVEQKQIVALLDEAFAGIDEAKDRLTQEIDQVNTVLQSKFNETFAQPPITFEATRVDTTESTFSAKGRKATSRNIAGSLSLCVGKPSSPARSGWRWIELSSLAQLESGHTPSRAKPEYWNGNIPWISIRDAKKSHGKVITDTEECITDLGVENSSARILPTNTVCLSRTASVGYCTITGRPMATSQDFVNWVIKGDLHPSFLKFIFLAEGDQLLRFASGSVHQTIYYPETKAFAVCIPNLTEQVRIARHLEELTLAISQLRDKLTNKQVHLAKLKSSMLAEAFAGELTA
jgi:restriction endonuclease S subunit